MTRRDMILVISAFLFFALSFFFFNDKADVKSHIALAVYNEEVLAEIDLSKDMAYGFGITKDDFKPVFLKAQDFNKTAYASYNLIVVKGGSISVSEASCPDRLCTKFAPISRGQDMIVCLPHKFYIKLEDGGEGSLDAISE